MKIQNVFHLMKLITGLARDLHFAKSFQFGVRGSNPGGRRDFPHPFGPTLGPIPPPVQ